MSAIEQPAARSGRITFCSRRGEDVGGLGHEVHAAEDDELRLRPGRGVAGELEGVAGDVGELDDLVALVVVPEHEHAARRAPPSPPGPAPPGPGRRPPAGRPGTRRRARRRGPCPGRAAAAGDRRSSWPVSLGGRSEEHPVVEVRRRRLHVPQRQVALLVQVEPGLETHVDRPLVGRGDVPDLGLSFGRRQRLPEQPGRSTTVGGGAGARRVPTVRRTRTRSRSTCRRRRAARAAASPRGRCRGRRRGRVGRCCPSARCRRPIPRRTRSMTGSAERSTVPARNICGCSEKPACR